MKSISEWIDKIIQDIVDSNVSLNDTMLKLQVLASKLDNSQLREWVAKELNGYKKISELPDYRLIKGVAFGKLVQDRGFGGALFHNNIKLPTESLESEFCKELETISILASVSELEHMKNGDADYAESISVGYFGMINKCLANGWRVESAWKPITKPSIEKVLNSIKSSLLNFLLELNSSIGDNEDYTVLKKKREVEKLFSETIGKISAKQVNLTFGDNSMQAVNSGETMNVAQGKNFEQTINDNIKEELFELIKLIDKNLSQIPLNQDDKDDLINELQRLRTQSQRENPKVSIINAALKTVNGLLLGVATNAYTPIIMEKIQHLMSSL